MIRIPDTESMGQLRVMNSVNQYSNEAELMKAGYRPDLGPSDIIPMGLKTSWVNPGDEILEKEGEILPLTPLGPDATNVFPGVYPAPADTQDLDFEDRIPRIEDRGDQVLRSRSGIRGPAQYWKYGGLRGLGQEEGDPVMFYTDPSEVAYQTYPGAFLGQDALTKFGCTSKQVLVSSGIMTAVGAAIAFMGAPMAKDKDLKYALTVLGVLVGGVGMISLTSEVGHRIVS